MTEFSSSSFSAGNAAIVRHAADSTLDRPFQRRGSHRGRFCVADRSLLLSLSLLRRVTRKHERAYNVAQSSYAFTHSLSLSCSLPALSSSLSIFSLPANDRTPTSKKLVPAFVSGVTCPRRISAVTFYRFLRSPAAGIHGENC